MKLPDFPVRPELKWSLFLACISSLIFCIYEIASGLISETISIPLKGHTGAVIYLKESPLKFFLCFSRWLILAFNSGYIGRHIYHRKTISKNSEA